MRMRDAVENVLETVRKTLRLHAGGIELVDIDESQGIVTVHLTGTCDGCALSQITLKRGVETALCQAIPEIREVIAV
jgi:Fe-S cluster biogenesis protein NfuA